MKKYVKLGLGMIGFVAFLAGIYFLYDYLAAEYKPQQNLVVENKESSEQPTATPMSINTAEPNEEAGGTEAATAAPEEEQSSMAIDFIMENGAGEEVALFDFVGKPIVLNF